MSIRVHPWFKYLALLSGTWLYRYDMFDIHEFESHTLAPYAQRSAVTRGRRHPETEHPWRGPFMRDRDRIIHCTSFRRLENKTQVFVIFEGDYYRNRLTHTIEAAQIARTLARGLGLNEDLAEAIALAHDLGHPPFGHVGEAVLHELMHEHGGFEHNNHGLRIVDALETRYPGFPGLNLTFEVREGIAKHKTGYDAPDAGMLEDVGMPTLEAQLVNVADEITYSSHDVDDGLKSGLLSEDILRGATICRDILDAAQDPVMRHYQLIRRLIDRQVNDVLNTSRSLIEQNNIRALEDVRAAGCPLISFSGPLAAQAQELRDILMTHFYRHHRVASMANKARRILKALFDAYMDDPVLIPPETRARSGGAPLRRAVCDYIAGMTDRYALEEHRRLFTPFERL